MTSFSDDELQAFLREIGIFSQPQKEKREFSALEDILPEIADEPQRQKKKFEGFSLESPFLKKILLLGILGGFLCGLGAGFFFSSTLWISMKHREFKKEIFAKIEEIRQEISVMVEQNDFSGPTPEELNPLVPESEIIEPVDPSFRETHMT